MFYCTHCKQKKSTKITFWCHQYNKKKNIKQRVEGFIRKGGSIAQVVWLCPDCLILSKRGMDSFNKEGTTDENHSILEFADSHYQLTPKYITIHTNRAEWGVGTSWRKVMSLGDEDKGKPVTLVRNIYHKGYTKCNCCGKSLIDMMYMPLGKVETRSFTKVQVAPGLNLCQKCLRREFEANKHLIIATLV